jgi:hypothetical protein
MGQEITSFPNEIHDILGYYVYKLIDPRNGQVFYVGRGKGDRIFQHLRNELSEESYLDEINDEEANIEIPMKKQTIRDIRNEGLNVIHIIHRHGLTFELSKEVEASLLDDYSGVTNIQGGYGSIERGPMNVQQIINKYQMPVVRFDEEDRIMLINIKSSIKTNISIYDATRYAWKVNSKNANKADFIISHSSGVILEVFKLDKSIGWMPAINSNFQNFPFPDWPERKSFQKDNSISEDMTNRFVGHKLPDNYKNQALNGRNPIKYINI